MFQLSLGEFGQQSSNSSNIEPNQLATFFVIPEVCQKLSEDEA